MKHSFELSKHAQRERVRRGIPENLLNAVLREPEQVVDARGAKRVHQSRLDFGKGKIFLLRAVVAYDVDPPLVVTVYRMSKIQKYWEEP